MTKGDNNYKDLFYYIQFKSMSFQITIVFLSLALFIRVFKRANILNEIVKSVFEGLIL